MNDQPRALAAGDRVPNFMLNDQHGDLFEFYIAITGGSIVLALVSNDDANSPALLTAFNDQRAKFEAQNAHLYVVRHCRSPLSCRRPRRRVTGETGPRCRPPPPASQAASDRRCGATIR